MELKWRRNAMSISYPVQADHPDQDIGQGGHRLKASAPYVASSADQASPVPCFSAKTCRALVSVPNR
jgi:hypothetical protein